MRLRAFPRSYSCARTGEYMRAIMRECMRLHAFHRSYAYARTGECMRAIVRECVRLHQRLCVVIKFRRLVYYRKWRIVILCNREPGSNVI